MGKVSLPMDIRSSSDIPAFEDMLSKGPMAVILVYADWCGHCTKYKDNVWSPLKSTKNRKLNMASVHYDQLENTSLKNSKIEGYPSLLVVGTDKQPAAFNTDSGVTNAMPNANDLNTMKKLVTAPVANIVNNTNSMNSMNSMNSNNGIMNSMNSNNTNMNSMNSNNGIMNSMNNSNNFTNLRANNVNVTSQETPGATIENITPPNISSDTVSTLGAVNSATNSIVENNSNIKNNTQGTTPLLRGGGRLYRKLATRKQRRHKKRSLKRKN